MMGAPFHAAALIWPGEPDYDDGGSITVPGMPVSTPAKVQFDQPTEQMRADPQFLERDMRVIVLAESLDRALDTTPSLFVGSGPYAGTWSIESCQGDSAGIGWECRARKVG